MLIDKELLRNMYYQEETNCNADTFTGWSKNMKSKMLRGFLGLLINSHEEMQAIF